MTDSFTMEKKTYDQSLEDPRWRQLRIKIIDRDGERCKLCGSSNKLQVHHRQYHRYKESGEWLKPWEYHPIFLVTLCDTCHTQGHSDYSVPIKEILKKTQL